MKPEGSVQRPADRSDQEVTRLLPLLSNEADRDILGTWSENQREYRLIDPEPDGNLGAFDCCLVDPPSLREHGSALLEQNEQAPVPLPYVLVVPADAVEPVRSHLEAEDPELWSLINGVLRTPITETELEMQLSALVRIREQAKESRHQEAQLRSIRDEHAGHGVVITDETGTIQFVNQAFEEQSGYREAAVVGKNPSILQSGVHDEAFYADLWDTIESGEVWHGEVTNERKDGSQYILDQTIAPIFDLNGTVIQYVAINHEITELRGLEDRLRDRNRQLELLNQILRHDVRNDMNVIQGWTQTVETQVPTEAQSHLDRISQAANHVTELTKNARDLVEAIGSSGSVELEPVSIKQVLSDEIQKRRERFDAATILVDGSIPDGSIRANEMLSSVFRNLINNGIKHNPDSNPHILIDAERTGDQIVVAIEDDGPGIPPNIAESLFEESTKGIESSGTGMGLYLVKQLMEIFDGSIRVEDGRGRSIEAVGQPPGDSVSGTRFVLTFPLDHAETAETTGRGG